MGEENSRFIGMNGRRKLKVYWYEWEKKTQGLLV